MTTNQSQGGGCGACRNTGGKWRESDVTLLCHNGGRGTQIGLRMEREDYLFFFVEQETEQKATVRTYLSPNSASEPTNLIFKGL